MSVYAITNSTNFYNEFKALAIADLNLDIEYDDGTNDLVLYHNGLGVYLELDELNGSYAPKIWVGLSWTSGETLNDRKQVTLPYNITMGQVIVGATYMIIGWYGSSTQNGYLFFGTLSNDDLIVIGGNGTTNANYSKTYNLTKAEECNAVLLSGILATSFPLDGTYAKLPLYLANATGVYSDGAGVPYYVNGLALLLRGANTTSVPFEVYGTDVILNAYKNSGGTNITACCLLGEGLYV